MLPRESKKKGMAWWLPASVAAALMLFFAWQLLLNKPVTNNEQLAKTNQEASKAGSSDKTNKNENTVSPDLQGAPQEGNAKSLSAVTEKHDAGIIHPENKIFNSDPSGEFRSSQKSSQSIAEAGRSEYPYLNQQYKVLVLQRKDRLLFANTQISHINILIPSLSKPSKEKSMDLKETSASRLSLGLAFSPDINSVSGFKTSKLGQSFGLSANYRLSPRFSISSGIAYSTKLYSAQPNQYKAPWAYSNAAKYAESIDADCRVLDVPVNLNYNLHKSPKRTMFVSAGVSSYFMLKEKYTLIAANQPGYPTYPDRSYEYSKQNEHLLSVLNLSAGVAKPLNKQTSLVIEPYARLPLAGVGEGKVNLKSIGLNLQLQYNFRKKEKPGSTSVIAVQ